MKVVYDVLDPTGNTTILVRTPVPEAEQPAVAASLMKMEPETEQVGFLMTGCKRGQDRKGNPVSDYDIDLRMAGGEFCGNASMCAAVIAAIEAGQSSLKVNLRVSGASGRVGAEVARLRGGDWTGTVDMPKPMAIENVSLPGAGSLPVIRFEGISHIILQQEMPFEKAEELAPLWCGILGADAIGLLFLDLKVSTLTPLVYVPAADTLCWERSCASGTTAVCAYLADKNAAPLSINLRQPGGELRAEASLDGKVRLSGKVRILMEKETDIMLN